MTRLLATRESATGNSRPVYSIEVLRSNLFDVGGDDDGLGEVEM